MLHFKLKKAIFTIQVFILYKTLTNTVGKNWLIHKFYQKTDKLILDKYN